MHLEGDPAPPTPDDSSTPSGRQASPAPSAARRGRYHPDTSAVQRHHSLVRSAHPLPRICSDCADRHRSARRHGMRPTRRARYPPMASGRGRSGLCQPTRQRRRGRRATRRVQARGDQGVRPPARRGAPTSGSTPGASAGTRANRRSPGGGGTTCTSGSPRSPRSVAARGGMMEEDSELMASLPVRVSLRG